MNANAFALTFAFFQRTDQRQKSKRASKLTHQDSDTMDRHNTTEKEERTANRGFREMAGFVVVSSVVLLINFSGRLAVLCF